MENLKSEEFKNLTLRVFGAVKDGAVISVLSDVPDNIDDDDDKWLEQRQMASEWIPVLREAFPKATVDFVQYRSVGRNNGNLPTRCAVNVNTSDIWRDEFNNNDFSKVLERSDIIYAPTRYSTTAPLKSSASQYQYRAATMPGFTMAMADALRVDYTEVNRRVMLLKNLLDRATGALASFTVAGETWKFHMDLRHRTAHASGGILNT
ncbi:hypothetical protein KKD49_12775, partial [Myxococcota bacterium]|nr:hypothetical protein [Myxococcota bacterium]